MLFEEDMDEIKKNIKELGYITFGTSRSEALKYH